MTNQECLGYGKLFVWNQGVASRGKMMGKTFSAPGDASDADRGEERSPPSGAQDCVLRLPTEALVGNQTPVHVAISGPLLDPLYQSLDETSRRYLFHFATNVCSDLVIAASDANPFRRLVPLCRDYPILRHAINAAGALNVSCLHRRATNSESELSCGFQTLQTPRQTDASCRALVDALTSKQKALVLLRQALEDIDHIDVDLIVTIVHLLIIFELMSPGGDEWRAHVQGSLRLISYLQTLEPRQVSPAALIRDTITSDCLTWYILGSTLMNTTTLSDPFLFPGDITASLTRAEITSYISLPTVLLHNLFKACELSNLVSAGAMLNSDTQQTDYTPILAQAETLLQTTKSFNAHAWALSVEGAENANAPLTLSRMHTALAHQNAVLIYITRSVDTIASPEILLGEGEDTERLVTNIITHLSLVGSADPIFVATTWPTFIAGAETDNPVYRRWALERLSEFWNLMPWGYVRTAMEVMRTTWRLRDQGAANGQGEPGRTSWIQQLRGLERYWLIA
ncbi:hypothetical protein BDW74DRAFT_174780 [Aspergillus multicolor]|uniref:uncharacterized protein n=1 Tax=Aspergillus multicolor TaxID=41759 RepID=UPI003CCDF4E3